MIPDTVRTTRRILALIVLNLLAVANRGLAADKDAVGEPSPPNIVFIVADDLGWNDVGYHGGTIKTPNIDQLARDGLRFNRFYVSAVCSPSRATLLTGRYPDRYGFATHAISFPHTVGIPENEETLPEMLAKNGYNRRALIGKWHVGHTDRKHHPLQQGFTYFYGQTLGGLDYFTHVKSHEMSKYAGSFANPYSARMLEKGVKELTELEWHENYEPNYDKGYTTDLIADKSVEFIRKSQPGEPFFLMVAFNAPHSPYQAKPEDIDKYRTKGEKTTQRQVYYAMVDSMDQAVGRILNALSQANQVEQTIVFFCSDNGANRVGDNSPLKGGKYNIWEGGIRVPAIVRWPGKIAPGTQSNDVTGVVDIIPTLRDIVRAKEQPPLPLDGVSIKDVLLGGAGDPDRVLCVARYADRVAVTRDYKLFNNRVYKMDSTPGDPLPTETKDIAAEVPEVQARLKAALNKSGVKHLRMDASAPLFREHRMPQITNTIDVFDANVTPMDLEAPMAFRDGLLLGTAPRFCKVEDGGNATVSFTVKDGGAWYLQALVQTPVNMKPGRPKRMKPSFYFALNGQTLEFSSQITDDRWIWSTIGLCQIKPGTHELYIRQGMPNAKVKGVRLVQYDTEEATASTGR
jgi:arylsulfatase B